jgi:hypothetical protein
MGQGDRGTRGQGDEEVEISIFFNLKILGSSNLFNRPKGALRS